MKTINLGRDQIRKWIETKKRRRENSYMDTLRNKTNERSYQIWFTHKTTPLPHTHPNIPRSFFFFFLDYILYEPRSRRQEQFPMQPSNSNTQRIVRSVEWFVTDQTAEKFPWECLMLQWRDRTSPENTQVHCQILFIIAQTKKNKT